MGKLIQKIVVTSGKKKHLILITDITLVKAHNIYSIIYLQNGDDYLVTETISQIHTQLNSPYFYRTHRSYVVNISYIETYDKAKQKLTIINSNNLIPIARDKKKDFAFFLNTMFKAIAK